MIHAYDKIYVDKAQAALARMIDFAVYDLHYDIRKFFDMFIESGIADRFGKGDFTLIAGKSGVELAYEVIYKIDPDHERVKPRYTMNRSEEFWLGWALAYYQWYTGLSFKEILEIIPVDNILSMYSPYHEIDIRHFVDKMNSLYRAGKYYSNLKKLRMKAGLSQSQLAKESEIPVRTLQQYEQGQKHINKAQAEYLIRLSQVLCCDVKDLIEKV